MGLFLWHVQFDNIGQFLRQVIRGVGAAFFQLSSADVAEMPLHVLPDLRQGGAGRAEEFFKRGDGFT